MVMRMHRMIKEMDPEAVVVMATSENQIPQIKAQLGEQVGISVEPSRRDTFPAIALAAAYLKTQGVDDDESVVVCPVDPYVEADYFECLKEYVSEARPMYERREWGENRVFDYKRHVDNSNCLIKELIIEPGYHISYQRHFQRTEIWTFTKGVGELVLDGEAREIERGEVVVIRPGTKHAVRSITELH